SSPFGKQVCVHTCHSTAEAMSIASEFQPDLILMDLYICDARFAGIGALEDLGDALPEALRIAITAHGANLSDDDLRRIDACQLDGLIDKSRRTKGILELAHQIFQGNSWFEPAINSRLRQLRTNSLTKPKKPSKQERKVLVLRAQGCTYQDIAKELKIDPGSVCEYMRRIKGKLGFNQPVQLYAYCREQGILP
ncbi:MAG: DNA-binding response regulator, partial [Candidatus Sericytochromatia bacterium]